MFFRVKIGKDGKDEQGKTYQQVFIEHINWCIEMLSGRIDHLYDSKDSGTLDSTFHKSNALGNLKIFYEDASIRKEGGIKLEKAAAAALESFLGEPIEEIINPGKFSELNHKWKWLPFAKEKHKDNIKI